MTPGDLSVDVVAEVHRIRAALERPFEVSRSSTTVERQWRIVQTCLVCEIELALTFGSPTDRVSGPWLHRQVFALYDDHRCALAIHSATDAQLHVLYERTERESVRIAERAAAIEHTLLGPDFFARAEREFVLLAELADTISRRFKR